MQLSTVGLSMMDKDKASHSAFPPLVIVALVLVCLMFFLVPGLSRKIIDLGVAISISIAVGALTYSVFATLYTKRYSLLSISALFIGALFYANSAVCYVFGVSLLNYVVGRRAICSWGLIPNQTSHGLVMLGRGFLIVVVAVRSLIVSKERDHVEKIIEYVLISIGAIQSVIGTLALISR